MLDSVKHSLCFCLGLLFCLQSHAAQNDDAFRTVFEELVNANLTYQRQQNASDLTKAANIPDRYVFSPTLNAESHVYRSGPPGTNDYGASANGAINLFHFGEDKSRYQAASIENALQSELLTQALWQAESESSQLLFALLQAQQTLKIKLAMQQLDVELLQVGEKQYASGRRSLQDLQKLKIEAANDAAALSDARQQEKKAQAALVARLGHQVSLADWPWKNVFLNQKTNDLTLTKDDLQKRPDYVAAVRMQEVAHQRHLAAQKEYLPSLDASVSYGFDYVENNSTVSSSGASILFPGSQETWLAKLSLSIPLWDKGLTLSRSQSTFYAEKKAELDRRQIEQQAQEQYESLQPLFENALHSIKERLNTDQQAKNLFAGSQKRFQQGMLSVNDLITDQQMFYNTELLVIQGWLDAHSYFMDLCHAKNLSVGQCLQTIYVN